MVGWGMEAVLLTRASTHLHTDTHIHAHIRSLLGLVRAFPLYCSHMGRLAFLWYLIAGHVLLTSGLL